MMKNLSIRNKKGFTLVEVIAVLVILAILIAIVVPSVNGYIQKAKEREAQLTARNVYLAACVESADYLASHSTVALADIKDKVVELAGIDADKLTAITFSATYNVESITYNGTTYPN